jgi:glycosyltransferase involved in cell wall biosynthesis
MEEKLLAKTDVVITVSESLQERLAKMGRSSHLLTHGVELEFWAGNSESDLPDELRACEPPWIVFWGLLDERMDSAFVNQLASQLSNGTILLAGPHQNSDRALTNSPRVRCLGKLPFESLPALASGAGVLIMPYADMPVTRAMQPLKLKEYLATGKPVVVRNLPAARQWSDALDLADSPAQFSALVRERLGTGLPDKQRQARTRLVSESWKLKAQQFREIVFGS